MTWTAIIAGLATAFSPSADDQATPAGWTRQRLGVGAFSIAVPPGVQGGLEQGVDSLVAGYRGPGFTLSLDFGMYGGRPDCGARPCSSVEIDGVPAMLRRGEEPAWPDEPGMTHRLHLYVPLVDPAGSDELSLVAYAHCATAAACNTAERPEPSISTSNHAAGGNDAPKAELCRTDRLRRPRRQAFL